MHDLSLILAASCERFARFHADGAAVRTPDENDVVALVERGGGNTPNVLGVGVQACAGVLGAQRGGHGGEVDGGGIMGGGKEREDFMEVVGWTESAGDEDEMGGWA
jgi:hypothetical protein